MQKTCLRLHGGRFVPPERRLQQKNRTDFTATSEWRSLPGEKSV
nr:MAG TPA: hypothetical protein [Caudoviricetes sp.]